MREKYEHGGTGYYLKNPRNTHYLNCVNSNSDPEIYLLEIGIV